ncbi:ABC-type multidrug transport system ATPase subunit [Streptomyces sp. V4I23]|uniref:hypothetical protein n=1 Tax=Streptomyces sp. V4I23 TaxID=3042282 RepID=UPI00278322E9|nr:hypothetical protein [Streptomyces sp. V4I23]MDQ1007883.1 ABC-type multidrug transport system ATPase subunit [Streptomyces sp. V4I23]
MRRLRRTRGNTLHRIADPAREVGVLLGDVPGHPAWTARSRLRMLSAAVGAASRADELIDTLGLGGLRDEQLGLLSRGMTGTRARRRSVGSPADLVLDEPCRDLSSRDGRWIFEQPRTHAARGGTVLCTTADSNEAARIADRVTIDAGCLIAEQDVGDFSRTRTRTRLRSRVAARRPHHRLTGNASGRQAGPATARSSATPLWPRSGSPGARGRDCCWRSSR